MKCNTTKETIVDYFYDELSEKEKSALETHFTNCENCRKTLVDIKALSGALHTWKAPERVVNYVFTEEIKGTRRGIFPLLERIKRFIPSLSIVRRRPAAAFMWSIAAVFLMFSFANFKASYNNNTGTFVLSTSVFGTPEGQFNYELIGEYLDSIQKRNLELMDIILAEYEVQQREQTNMIVMDLVRDWQAQRELDLQYFGSSLQYIQEYTGNELNNTLAVVRDLFENAGAQEIKK